MFKKSNSTLLLLLLLQRTQFKISIRNGIFF